MTSILSFALAALLLLTTVFPYQTNAQKKKAQKKDTLITVYYFHGTRRCATCLAIEDVARKSIQEQFGKDPRVRFLSLNIDEKKNESIAEKYKVAGSSLFVSCRDKRTDLTVKAFRYAKNNPGKLQDLLLKTVGGFLE